jgi:hypothetical protein
VALGQQRPQELQCPAGADIASALQQAGGGGGQDPAAPAAAGSPTGRAPGAALAYAVASLGGMQLPCRDAATQAGTSLAAAVRDAAFGGAAAGSPSSPAAGPAPAPGPGSGGGAAPARGDPPGAPANGVVAPAEGMAPPQGSAGRPAGWRAALLAGIISGSVVGAVLLGVGAYRFGYRRWWRHRGFVREELAEGGIGMVGMLPSGAQRSAPAGPGGTAAAGGGGQQQRFGYTGRAAAAAGRDHVGV